eukprot:44713_1
MDEEKKDTFLKVRCSNSDADHTDILLKQNPSLVTLSTLTSLCPNYEVDYETMLFFLIPCTVIGACLFGFYILLRLPLTQVYYDKTREEMMLTLSNESSEGKDCTVNCLTSKNDGFSISNEDIERSSHDMLTEALLLHDFVEREEEDCHLDHLNSPASHDGSLVDNLTFCHHQNNLDETEMSEKSPPSLHNPCISLFFTFFCTLTLYPGWIGTLSSVHQCRSTLREYNDLFL